MGASPFSDETAELVHQNIIRAQIDIWPDVPEEMSSEAKDLISALLNPDKRTRLGSKDDAEEVKAHPWFNNVEWDSLLDQDPIFVPKPNICYSDGNFSFSYSFYEHCQDFYRVQGNVLILTPFFF